MVTCPTMTSLCRRWSACWTWSRTVGSWCCPGRACRPRVQRVPRLSRPDHHKPRSRLRRDNWGCRTQLRFRRRSRPRSRPGSTVVSYRRAPARGVIYVDRDGSGRAASAACRAGHYLSGTFEPPGTCSYAEDPTFHDVRHPPRACCSRTPAVSSPSSSSSWGTARSRAPWTSAGTSSPAGSRSCSRPSTPPSLPRNGRPRPSGRLTEQSGRFLGRYPHDGHVMLSLVVDGVPQRRKPRPVVGGAAHPAQAIGPPATPGPTCVLRHGAHCPPDWASHARSPVVPRSLRWNA